jgi:hypothetical protein
LSNKLQINPNNDYSTSNIFPTNTPLEDEWAEDIGGFWDDEVPEIVELPKTNPEPVSIEEIKHIKVTINN